MYNLRRCNGAIHENQRIFTLVTLIDSYGDFFLLSQFPSLSARRLLKFGEVPFNAKDFRFLLMSSSFQLLGKVSIPRFRLSRDFDISLVPRF
jgi:hypothetical protein